MRQSFSLPDVYSAETLSAHLSSLAMHGLTGWSIDTQLHAEFPERDEGTDPLTEQEQADLAAHVAAYIHVPTWTAVRAEREPLLLEADHRINAAVDTGQDTAALRAYRQALRDVTEPPNTPTSFTWPTRPW